jgi:hypothetical protein
MRAFAMQVAGLKSSFHAGVPRTKLLAETKGCGLPGSRALYAPRSSTVNLEQGSRRRAQRDLQALKRLWITGAKAY